MKCVIMIGCPGSGKTYKAKEYEKKGYFRISQDDQGKKLHKLLFEIALEDKRDIVIDRMGFSREQRERYAREAKKNGYTVIYHRMIGLDKDCLRRCNERESHPNIKDSKTAERVIKFFKDSWEDIDFDEPLDELIVDGADDIYGKKCTCCGGAGELNYGPNKDVDSSGSDLVCDCDICEGTGVLKEDKYTCSKCKDRDDCPCAFDMYNTDGDCLMGK